MVISKNLSPKRLSPKRLVTQTSVHLLHRFWDTVTDLLAEYCEFFLSHSHLTPSLGMNPFKFLDELFIAEIGLVELSVGEDFVILACVVLTAAHRIS